jgi:transcriptional regulator with XRE-family HTH domain
VDEGLEGSVRLARNRRRQRELYGGPLGDRIRALTTALGITQARLARTLGVSPAMLSQLASARRVTIGDPAVLARLQLLHERCAAGPARRDAAAVEALLAEAARARWTVADGGAAAALRGLAPPARLAAAAALLAPGFPELAAALHRAARSAPPAVPPGPPPAALPRGRASGW